LPWVNAIINLKEIRWCLMWNGRVKRRGPRHLLDC
jgi:hypothetical protein